MVLYFFSICYSTDRSINGIEAPGRIIIRDRNRLQQEVLPFYFNHASFASLRRQLSYFSFVRLGNIRGRSTGPVTYINHNVYELSDILRLKRRVVGGSRSPTVSASATGSSGAFSSTPHESNTKEMLMIQDRKQSKVQDPDTTSKDVASAISSGKMHARETNHDLEDKYLQTESFNAVTLGTSSRALRKRNSKKNVGKMSCKYRLRKRRSKIERLVRINEMVPFIHIPAELLGSFVLKEDHKHVDSNNKKKRKKKIRRSEDKKGKTGQPKNNEKTETSSNNSSEENMQADKEPNSTATSSNDGAISSTMDSESPSSLTGSDPNSEQNGVNSQ